MSARKKQRKRYRQYLVNPNTPVLKTTYYRRQYEDSIMENVGDGDAAANSQFFNDTSPEVDRNIASEEFVIFGAVGDYSRTSCNDVIKPESLKWLCKSIQTKYCIC